MSRETQERIIDAAAELFSIKGYHQTSVDDIAERAGVAKGSIYYNYKGKSALLVAVIREGIDFVRKQVGDKTPPGAGPAERVRTLLETAFDVMVHYHALVGFALAGSCEGVDDEAKAQIKAARREIEDDLSALLAEGMSTGAIRTLPTEVTAQILVGSLERSVKVYTERGEGGVDSHEDIRRALLTILFTGLVADGTVLTETRPPNA